jgi:surface antigen
MFLSHPSETADLIVPAPSQTTRANIGRAKRAVALAARLCLLAAGLPLAGCATAIPLASFMGSSADVTGSIPPPSAKLSPYLDSEDWRRAKGAMGLALDPQGNGAPVSWDNAKSGARGSFTPVGEARPVDDKICRAFLADVGGAAPARALQGTACRDKSGDWTLGDVKPWTAPRAG